MAVKIPNSVDELPISSPRFIAVTGGPCGAAAAATPIPVLSPLGLLTLTALLGMLGILFVRRQLS